MTTKLLLSLPILCGIAAFGLGVAASTTCDFLRADFVVPRGSIDGIYPIRDSTTRGTHVGIWCEPAINGTNALLHYLVTDIDGYWKASRAFSILALVFGITFLLLDMGTAMCGRNRNMLYRSGGGNYFMCCLFAGLTLLLLESNGCSRSSSGCSLSKGATLMIASTVLWFVAGLIVCAIFPPWRRRDVSDTEEHILGPSMRDPLMKGRSDANINP